MAEPTEYHPSHDFVANPDGDRLNDELYDIEAAISGTQAALRSVRRSDGALQNGVVTTDSLSPSVKKLLEDATGAPVTDDFATLTGLQTLSNKTLVSPVLSGAPTLPDIPAATGATTSDDLVALVGGQMRRLPLEDVGAIINVVDNPGLAAVVDGLQDADAANAADVQALDAQISDVQASMPVAVRDFTGASANARVAAALSTGRTVRVDQAADIPTTISGAPHGAVEFALPRPKPWHGTNPLGVATHSFTTFDDGSRYYDPVSARNEGVTGVAFNHITDGGWQAPSVGGQSPAQSSLSASFHNRKSGFPTVSLDNTGEINGMYIGVRQTGISYAPTSDPTASDCTGILFDVQNTDRCGWLALFEGTASNIDSETFAIQHSIQVQSGVLHRNAGPDDGDEDAYGHVVIATAGRSKHAYYAGSQGGTWDFLLYHNEIAYILGNTEPETSGKFYGRSYNTLRGIGMGGFYEQETSQTTDVDVTTAVGKISTFASTLGPSGTIAFRVNYPACDNACQVDVCVADPEGVYTAAVSGVKPGYFIILIKNQLAVNTNGICVVNYSVREIAQD